MTPEDDAPLTGSVDTVSPWTIKAISVEARNLVTTAARKEGVTVGYWLERLIRQSVGDGEPRQTGTAVVGNPGKRIPHPASYEATAAMVRLAVDIAALPETVRSDAVVRSARSTVRAMLGRLREG